MCVSDGGSSACSYGCRPENANADCPSGYVCTDGAGTNGQAACIAKPSCSTVLQAFGTVCVDDFLCAQFGLADAKCVGLVKGKKGTVTTPGYCSSRCTVAQDCPTALGFTCDLNQGSVTFRNCLKVR